MEQALLATRPGGRVGSVGAPHLEGFPYHLLFAANKTLAAGVAPVRAYLPDLLSEVLEGAIEPGRVFDLELPLSKTADAYEAMSSRQSIKTLLRPE
jgi:threonine dehydrogenase-like Zn-dependent dehydrogenase